MPQEHLERCQGLVHSRRRILVRTFCAWRLLTVQQGRKLRKSYRLAASLHLRWLLRSWHRACQSLRAVRACDASKHSEVQVRIHYREYREKRKAKFIQQRMLRLRAACMSRVHRIRSMARAGQKAFSQWRRVSRMAGLERSVDSQEQMYWQTWLRLIFEKFVQLAEAVKTARSLAKKLHGRQLVWVLRAFQKAATWSKALRERRCMAQLAFRQRRLKQSLVYWQSTSLTCRQHRVQDSNVLIRLRTRSLQQAFAKLRNFAVTRSKCQAFAISLQQQSASRALQGLHQAVLLSNRGHATSSMLKESLLRSVLCQWVLLLRLRERMAALSEDKLFCVRQLVFQWWRGLNVHEALCWWQIASRFQAKEREAAVRAARISGRCASAVLQDWGAAAKQLRSDQSALHQRRKLLLLRCSWRSWERFVAVQHRVEALRRRRQLVWLGLLLKAWRRRVVCSQNLDFLLRQRGERLCKRSIRCLCAYVLERRYELELQGQVLLAWLEWTTLRRQVRDDVAWQRWADGVADLFISRRLLRGLPTCFSTWCHSVRQQRAIRGKGAALQADMNMRSLQFAFKTFRWILAMRRVQRIDDKRRLAEVRSCFLHFRLTCQMSAKAEMVQTVTQGGRRARASFLNFNQQQF